MFFDDFIVPLVIQSWTFQIFCFNFDFFDREIFVIKKKKPFYKWFIGLIWISKCLNIFPISFVQILFKGIYWFKVENPSKNNGSFVFYFRFSWWYFKANRKMIWNITFKIAVLKFLSIKELLRIWSIAVAVVVGTLVGLFMVGIMPFL